VLIEELLGMSKCIQKGNELLYFNDSTNSRIIRQCCEGIWEIGQTADFTKVLILLEFMQKLVLCNRIVFVSEELSGFIRFLSNRVSSSLVSFSVLVVYSSFHIRNVKVIIILIIRTTLQSVQNLSFRYQSLHDLIQLNSLFQLIIYHTLNFLEILGSLKSSRLYLISL